MSSKFRHRYSKTYLFIIACFWAGFSFFTSCSPDSGIGANVLPAGDVINANFKDTATLHTTVMLKDSDLTTVTSSCLLGSYTDPVFGVSKASIFTQLLLANGTAITFPAGAIVDSAVLRLPFSLNTNYRTFYGSLSPQTVEVYQMTDSLIANKPYYSDTVIKYGALIGKQTVTPNPYTLVYITYPNYNPVYYYPEVHIKLDTTWIRNNIVNAPATALASNAAFLEHLRGIYIRVANPMQLPGQGAILYIDPAVAGGGLFLYYHYKVPVVDTTARAEAQFNIGTAGGGVSFSHFDHDYSGSPFYAGPSATSVSTPTLTYLQAMGGVKVKITFPYLKNWIKKSPIIVNKAVIEIPVNSADMDDLAPPTQLDLLGIFTGDTGTYGLADYYLPSYGGNYDQFNKVYVFDIALYIQSVLDGKIVDNGLYLVVRGSAISANRVVLYGPQGMSASSPHMRLKMYYTPLKS